MKTALIFGGSGMIGQEFFQTLSKSMIVMSISYEQCDITSIEAVVAQLSKYHPDIIIKCAGIIDVESCEKDPDRAFLVNTQGVKNIVDAMISCDLKGCIFVQMSTAYVFEGSVAEYSEDDLPNPGTIYGLSKYKAEQEICSSFAQSSIRYYIIRTGWVYSEFRQTFIDLVVDSISKGDAIDIVTDQSGVITWAHELTEAVQTIMLDADSNPSGIYHVTNNAERAVSKYEIAVACARIFGFDVSLVRPIDSTSLQGVKRPRYSFLKTNKGIVLPQWQESLQHYLMEKYG
ncbi:MAG: NAD(P)-dependent oxidoreductase [Candidatus Magasanikbacteria bacterium]|nr:NAD(P)-dependent oxidoreductase [Candidatus Magasanikbacteria bacterium]